MQARPFMLLIVPAALVACAHTELGPASPGPQLEFTRLSAAELPLALGPGRTPELGDEVTVVLTDGRREHFSVARPAALDGESIVVDRGPGKQVLAMYARSDVASIEHRRYVGAPSPRSVADEREQAARHRGRLADEQRERTAKKTPRKEPDPAKAAWDGFRIALFIIHLIGGAR